MERGIIQKMSHPKACGEHSTLPPSPKGQGHEPWPRLCTYALRPPDVTCSLGGQFPSTAVTSPRVSVPAAVLQLLEHVQPTCVADWRCWELLSPGATNP